MQKPNNLVVLAIPRHSANPTLDLLYAAVKKMGVTVRKGTRREIVTGQYDVVHYHWIEVFLNYPSRWQRWKAFIERFVLILVLKVRRKKAVWTMHDIQPHEQQGRFLPALYRLIFFWSIDGLIALSEVSAQIMLERYPALRGKPLLPSRLGHYRSCYPHILSKQEAKQRAGLTPSDVVIGFFGSIRPYKNVPHLVRVFQQLDDRALHLIIAGGCIDDALTQELVTLTADDPRIQLKLEFVPDAEVAQTVCAADLMVLPFRKILNSASVLLALSFNVPVLVPAQGTLLEVAELVGPAWVRTYADTLTPEILADALQWAAQPRATPAPLDQFDWEVSGQETAKFLRTIARGVAGGVIEPRPSRTL